MSRNPLSRAHKETHTIHPSPFIGDSTQIKKDFPRYRREDDYTPPEEFDDFDSEDWDRLLDDYDNN